jgi:light-regulated signal transduction histidine kinase (bacteriophytochrome)
MEWITPLSRQAAMTQVTVESQVGEGSTFVVWLRLTEGREQPGLDRSPSSC